MCFLILHTKLIHQMRRIHNFTFHKMLPLIPSPVIPLTSFSDIYLTLNNLLTSSIHFFHELPLLLVPLSILTQFCFANLSTPICPTWPFLLQRLSSMPVSNNFFTLQTLVKATTCYTSLLWEHYLQYCTIIICSPWSVLEEVTKVNTIYVTTIKALLSSI